MKENYTIDDFLNIIEVLRGEEGCPWDRVQTHHSLRSCMMEEAAELISSIRIYEELGNAENMREELGDILLQVVMHSQIAKEERLFDFQDVVQEVSQKMIRRHPHVFLKKETLSENQQLSAWEEIKKKEKEGKNWIASPLREIPYELPSLTRAAKVQKKIDKLYEKQDSLKESMNKLQKNLEILSEMGLEEEKSKEFIDKIEKEIQETLWNLCNFSRIYKFSLEQLLQDKIEEMILRCEK